VCTLVSICEHPFSWVWRCDIIECDIIEVGVSFNLWTSIPLDSKCDIIEGDIIEVGVCYDYTDLWPNLRSTWALIFEDFGGRLGDWQAVILLQEMLWLRRRAWGWHVFHTTKQKNCLSLHIWQRTVWNSLEWSRAISKTCRSLLPGTELELAPAAPSIQNRLHPRATIGTRPN